MSDEAEVVAIMTNDDLVHRASTRLNTLWGLEYAFSCGGMSQLARGFSHLVDAGETVTCVRCLAREA